MKKVIIAAICLIMCSTVCNAKKVTPAESKYFVENLNKIIQEYEDLTKEVNILTKSLELEKIKVKDLTEKNKDLETQLEILRLERGDFKSKILSMEAQLEEVKSFIRRKAPESYKSYEDKILILTQEISTLKKNKK